MCTGHTPSRRSQMFRRPARGPSETPTSSSAGSASRNQSPQPGLWAEGYSSHMSDYVQGNSKSRARLAFLCERINDEQLARIAFGDWTVSAVLAHMAFWDRVPLERWNTFTKERQPVLH